MWATLAALLAAAFALRLGLALAFPNVHYPDEIFQTVEPAHRLLTGWGIVPWEWRAGIRSWLFPGFLAGLMALSPLPGPDGARETIAAAMSLGSLAVVAVGFLVGWRHSRLPGAVLCGGVCAVWTDLVYFAPKTLTEVPAAHLLVVAVWLAGGIAATDRFGRAGPDTKRPAVLGLLLGLAFCLRFHLAPALLLVAVQACRIQVRRRWLPLLLGAGVPVLLGSGILDLLTWGTPFQSVWKNVVANVIERGSEHYGVAPPFWYFQQMLEDWGAGIVPLAALFALGVARAPLFAATAFVILAVHMGIPHKEMRFIFPALALGTVVAAVGTAELVKRLTPPAPRRFRAFAPALAAVALWAAASAAVAVGPGYRPLWTKERDMLAVTRLAHGRADLCGLGLYQVNWHETGGYASLDRPVPQYLLWNARTLEQSAPSVNYILSANGYDLGYLGFRNEQCVGEVCLYHRAGGCTATPDHEINHILDLWKQ